MRRAARLAALAGVLALQYAVATAYLSRGTWWHWLLHQLVGWGIGLAAGSVLRPGRPAGVLAWALLGQLLSIVPDLMFRYLQMPHERWMDVWLGHISLHQAPSPVLVALAVFLLGGWAWVAAAVGLRRTAVVLAVAAPLLLAVACLMAPPVPSRLQDVPRDTSVVAR